MKFLAWSAVAAVVAAKTQSLDWNLSWKNVNPDGLKERPVVAINDEFPLPVVRIKKGDRLEVNVYNGLTEPARNTTMHFHGMFQNGTTHMDGPPMVNQCPQPPGTTFTYNFLVNQPGTYWYHAHVDDLYPDGYRQMLIVEDDEAPYEYDEEIAFSLGDWYHELYSTIRDRDFMNLYNPSGAEPVPASILFNDTTSFKTEIKPNTTYRIRISSTAVFSSFHWFIEGQNFTVVEVDGVFTDPYETNILYLATGQRYSVLFTTGSESVYRMGQVADQSVFDLLPEDLKLNNTGFLHVKGHPEFTDLTQKDIYEAVPKEPNTSLKHFTSNDIVKFDDMQLVPYDHMPLLPEPDHDITLKLELTNLLDGVNYAFLNGISYTPPKVPTLYSVLDAPYLSDASNASVYGRFTNTFVVDHLDVVQLVLNNYDSGQHPFHLHGHNFQVVVKGDVLKEGESEEDYNPYNPEKPPKFAEFPLRRDVVSVQPFSHIVLRWVADNPGVWFFHCHIEWHLTQGLAIQFVEAPAQIRQNEKIPPNHFEVCAKAGTPVRGNAAGHNDFYDLSGQNQQVPPLPEGFTPKGYAALLLSAVVALLGLWYIVWYGSENDDD